MDDDDDDDADADDKTGTTGSTATSGGSTAFNPAAVQVARGALACPPVRPPD